ncbi:RNA polymerase subunit sigma-24, partial [Enterococcus hirae]
MKSDEQDEAIVALLTEHQSALRLYVASLLPGESSTPDVAQQANATIWKKRDDFEIGTNFKAWAFSIARYEVLNFR